MDITLASADLNRLIEDPLVRGILDGTSDGAVVIDARTRRVLMMNQRARTLLGYTEQEVVGGRCCEAMNSPVCKLQCPLTGQVEGTGGPSELDLYYRARNSRKYLHAHARMIVLRDPRGAPLAGIELFRDLSELHALERALRQRRGLHGLVGGSGPMQQVYELIEQVAPYDLPVLITGESGVGKERVADALQFLSKRADGPYVKVHCATFNPSLIESELFGHVKGAYAGATSDRAGRFEQAHGGTLLLDEVGDLPHALHTRLLHVLRTGEVRRMGGRRTRKVDVRIIATTNQITAGEVADAHLNNDLYERLAGAFIRVPPLRERPEDVPALARFFLDSFLDEERRHGRDKAIAGFTDAAIAYLMGRAWPGNVRELRHTLHLAFHRVPAGEPVDVAHLQGESDPAALPAGELVPLAELERRAIRRAMEHTDGNLAAAARVLGIDRTTLWRKRKRLEEAGGTQE